MIPDRYIDGHVERIVSELRPGDRVDLEGDIFADPCGGATDSILMGDTDHPEFHFEFQVVEEAVRISDDCVRVHFAGGMIFDFPPDHWVDVDGEQVR